MTTTQITAIDPVCGMTVDPSKTRSIEYEGNSVFFCSESCFKKFEEDPQRVLTTRAKKDLAKMGITKEATSCCHSSGLAPNPTSKPKLEGSPIKTVDPLPAPGAIYTCPMHPQIEQVGPGDCPICGMDLEPKIVHGTNEDDDAQYQNMSQRFWVGGVVGSAIADHYGSNGGLTDDGLVIDGSSKLDAVCFGGTSGFLVWLAAVGSRHEIVRIDAFEYVFADNSRNSGCISIQSVRRDLSELDSCSFL